MRRFIYLAFVATRVTRAGLSELAVKHWSLFGNDRGPSFERGAIADKTRQDTSFVLCWLTEPPERKGGLELIMTRAQLRHKSRAWKKERAFCPQDRKQLKTLGILGCGGFGFVECGAHCNVSGVV